MKHKAEIAFDQMEAELMAAIKQHPELAESSATSWPSKEKWSGWRKINLEDFIDKIDEPKTAKRSPIGNIRKSYSKSMSPGDNFTEFRAELLRITGGAR
jgi:hypothetical protein